MTRSHSRYHRQLFEPGDAVGPFTIVDLIGQGGYGDIYSVTHPNSDHIFAMKLEAISATKRALTKEVLYLSNLQDSRAFPRLISVGRTATHVYVVLELLGPSISNVRRQTPEHKFSLQTGLRLSLAMLQALAAAHARGIVHGDVKPGNFLFRTASGELPIVLIDFGLSKWFIDPDSGKKYPEADKCGFRGTSRYASVSVHRGHDQCPKDDLVAWLYSTVELVEGRLPWTGQSDSYAVRMHKMQVRNADLVGKLPAEFREVADYLTKLRFGSNVNYDYLICLVSRAVRTVCGSLQMPYDWETLAPEKVLPKAIDYARTIPDMDLGALPEDSVDEEPCACMVA
jgi:serine/threonine protein kinase